MRTAILSDVHGNLVGLDAAIADLERLEPDQVVYLGDAVQGGPQPRETLERLRSVAWPSVQGNTDDWLARGAPQDDEAEGQVSDRTAEIGAWSVAQLGPESLTQLASWPLTREVDLGDGQTLLAFHGSPRSCTEVILPETDEEEFDKMVDGVTADVLAGGHTHLQQIRRMRGARFLNPGSVGFAYHRYQELESFRPDPWAEYAVVQSGSAGPMITFRRAPFSVEAAIDAIASSGMPHAESVAAPYRRLLGS